MAVQGRFKRNKEGKNLLAVKKMRQRKRKFEAITRRCNLCREEMEVSYRRAQNCETVVSKGHLNVGNYPLRRFGILTNAFPPLMSVFKTLS